MKKLLVNALAWFNQLKPASKLVVVVAVVLGLMVLLSPDPEEAAYGVQEESALMQLASTLLLLAIPIMLLGALVAAYDFRAVKKQNKSRLAGADDYRPLAYAPVPYRLAALVATGAFLFYEMVTFSQYEHTYIDDQRPMLWSIFGDYLARRIIIFGIIALSVAIVITISRRLLRTSPSSQPA